MLDFAGDAKHVESVFGNELHLALLGQRLVLVDYEHFHIALPACIDNAPAHILPRLGHKCNRRFEKPLFSPGC